MTACEKSQHSGLRDSDPCSSEVMSEICTDDIREFQTNVGGKSLKSSVPENITLENGGLRLPNN